MNFLFNNEGERILALLGHSGGGKSIFLLKLI